MTIALVLRKDEMRRAEQIDRAPKLLLNMKTFRNDWEIVGSKKLANIRADTDNTSDTQINDDLKLNTNINDPHVEKVYDEDLRGFCYEIGGSGIHITLSGSSNNKKALRSATLDIQAPYLLVLIKSLGADFTFELGVKDSQSVVRRIRFVSPLSVVKARNSQFTHNIVLAEASQQWKLYYINLASLMRGCFQQEFRFLHSMQVSSTLRIKAVLSSATDPSRYTSAELLQHLMLNHWPGGVGGPEFVYLSSSASPGAVVARPGTRHTLPSAKSADAQFDRPISAASSSANTFAAAVRPQTQGEACSSISSAVSSAATTVDTTKISEAPTDQPGCRPRTKTGAGTAPWEQDLYATIDLCEPPPSRKGIDSQTEDIWTPSLDAVIEEDHQRNTADTLAADDESVGSEGEIRRVIKAVAAPPQYRRHGVAGCKTIL